MTELEKVKRFAKEAGYSDAKFVMEWKGMRCYDPLYPEGLAPRTGFPYFVLVDPETGEIRYTDDDETFEIYDIVTQ